jgi:hypothetical protein
MNKTLSLCLKLTSAASLIVCAVWAWKQPDFEPIAATLGSLTALIALFSVEPSTKPKPPTMRQRGGKDSTNYQSGGDMNINPKS